MANTYTQIYLHVVSAVQGRESLIRQQHNDELQMYITGIVFPGPLGCSVFIPSGDSKCPNSRLLRSCFGLRNESRAGPHCQRP
jgi:hypothetical protein